jgi:hypothetical protein
MRGRELHTPPRRLGRRLAWLALPLALGFGALPGAPPALADSAQVISGPSAYASCSTPGNDTLYSNAETGPSIAANPATVGTDHVNLIAVWEQDRWQAINSKGLEAAYSNDGGKTWAYSNIPFGVCATGNSPYDRVSEPSVSIGPDGTAYVAGGGTKPDANALWVTTSRDGGKTWGSATQIKENDASTKYYADEPMVTADPTKPGTAYVVWNDNLTTDNGPIKIWLSKTTDGGKTWSKPAVLVNATNWHAAFDQPVLVDSHSGVLYEVYWSVAPNKVAKKTCKTVTRKGKKKKICTTKQVVPSNPTFKSSVAVVKSTDGGQTWSAPTTVHSIAEFADAANVASYAPLSAAIDPGSGKLYVAFGDGTQSSGTTEDISLVSSADGGATWSSAARVNAGAGSPAMFPTVAVNASGAVGVLYYAFPGSSKTAQPLKADVWFTSSTDGGQHFGNDQHLGGPYDLGSAPFITSGTVSVPYIGAAQGLTAAGSTFHAVFVAVNANNSTNPTDILTASLTP